MTSFTVSAVEDAALAWLQGIGWRMAHGPDIAPDTPAAERRDCGEVVLAQRLGHALGRLNPELAAEAVQDALRKPAPIGRGREVVFTTIQKFFPVEAGLVPAPDGATTRVASTRLTDCANIVVIVDEAHRSQYDFVRCFARHMRDALPHASFIGFTGTSIEQTDANTQAVFGDYISVYDIQRALEDGATVPIYYRSRLAKLARDGAERPKIDPDSEEATEGEEVERKEKLKTKWAQLEAIVGAEKRLPLVAQDIVAHFEQRLEAMDGKAMIVCMSRRICVELYKIICRGTDGYPPYGQTGTTRMTKGAIKVVMTGFASDPADWQPHIRNKLRRQALADHFRDPADPLRLVLVRDMWLAGFDYPSLHTMYVDKPMRGQGLMQAISRAVAPEGVVNIFVAAGLPKPDISILAEVRGMPQRSLAVELFQELLNGEISTGRRKNVAQARWFAEMLEQTIRRYQNRTIEAAQVIEKLIHLAKDLREANARGERLGLTEDELAFYDALETNDSAVKVLGDETLCGIARELVQTVDANVTTDWALRQNFWRRLRVLVQRILRKHGYPPDKQEKAAQTVLEQAAVLSAEWAAA